MNDEFGARASSTYAALIKQSLAGVRRAEALEIARGVASTRNAQRDARINQIREQRIGAETTRAEEAREARRQAKEELKYRHLYQQARAFAFLSHLQPFAPSTMKMMNEPFSPTMMNDDDDDE